MCTDAAPTFGSIVGAYLGWLVRILCQLSKQRVRLAHAVGPVEPYTAAEFVVLGVLLQHCFGVDC